MILSVCLACFMFSMSLAGSVRRPLKPGCPEPTDTRPCICYNSPFTYLQCKLLDDSEVLRKVFINSTRYGFQEVHIEYSVLQFLPHDMFEKVPVHALYLKNVTLVQLFDGPPKFLEKLDTLHIEETKVLRGIIWRLMEPLTHLRVLTIYLNFIKTLGTDFSKHVTKELKQLSFYETGTKSIKPGAFVDFVNLEKIAIIACKLTELRRDLFPNPFNVKVLYFDKNQLTSIPDDLFTNMPNLQTVGLKYNQISLFSFSSFQGSLSKLEYLMLEGNPIICDCRLHWLIGNKPPALSGKCDTPIQVHGKDIKDLENDFFAC